MSTTRNQIERRSAVTAAELIASRISIEVIDTGAAPNVCKKRLKGNNLQQAIQRAVSEQTTYTADGAITIQSGTHILSKTSAAAMTLAAPTAAQAGTRLTIICGTAYAHVITATNLLDDGVTGGAKDTATFTGGFVGSSLTLEAVNLKWVVVAKNVCDIAAV